jgi:hypothetical protein
LVETALVTSDIDTGKKVVEALDAAQVKIRTALWLYIPDSAEWRLILALPIVDIAGPEAGYTAVQKALAKHKVFLPLRRIQVIGAGEPLAQIVRRYVKTPGIGTSDIELGPTGAGRLMIEGAHVYRST